MLWKNTVSLELLSFSTRHVMFKISGDEVIKEWYCSGVYGWHNTQDKEKTWELLNTIKRNNREEWLCMGDFNEIMWSEEKRGENNKEWKCMRRFREALGYCGLMDLGFTGSPYTWSNGRRGVNNIRERLDRALANAAWRNIYQQVHIKHLPRYKSDHSPIMIDCGTNSVHNKQQRRCRMFRFEHSWLHHQGFQKILQDSWKETYMANNLGEKIMRCGESLGRWETKEFGNISKQEKELTDELKELQKNEEKDGQMDKIKKLEQQLDQILTREETMWFQRSRATWLKDGDRILLSFIKKPQTEREETPSSR